MIWEDDRQRVALWNAEHDAVPLRRCYDCHKDLDTERVIAYALGGCPLFGYCRGGVEIRCPNFTPKLPRAIKR